MAKKRRHRSGGRVTPKGTRPGAVRSPHPSDDRRWADPEPDLMRDVRRAVADPDPLGLLGLVSSLLAAVDPRRANPLARGSDAAPPSTSREEVVTTFVEVDRPETSALLSVIAAMSSDELERRRLQREVVARDHALPHWLSLLGGTRAYRSVEMAHVLRDGDNVIVGVRLPTGEELTAVVYIDHNVGTLVKDAFVVPEPIDELVRFMQSKSDDPDTTWADLDLADARTRITEAIERGAITVPPFETDTWPAVRPLVEWIANLLPGGGRGYERPEWSDAARQGLAERFLASPHGAGLDEPDHRDLVDDILWFGCDYGPGDPLRWSPVAVEMLLADWIPRKIVADAAHLAKAPDVVRAFIRFCHAERRIRPELTAETLAAVDRCEPDYQATIRSPRPQGAAALLAAIGALDPDGPSPVPAGPAPDELGELGEPGLDELGLDELGLDELGKRDIARVMRAAIERAVGGEAALDELTDEPLPDEPFTWDGIPADVRDRVGEVLTLCDRCCDELLDVEHRTACRRFLARAARGDPAVFRRKARIEPAAAAVCWVIGKANGLFTPYGQGMLVKDLLAHFGMQHGSVSQRASTLLKAAGIRTGTYDVELGTPELLVSAHRRRLIARRDRLTP